MNHLINRHVNYWFQNIQHDGQSPATTLREVTTLFLQHLQRYKLSLWLDERQLRRNICEAICTMYVATKQHSHWYGPFSKAERPEGWTREDERDWMDHLHFAYFSYDTWQSLWARIPVAYWESRLPNWRDAVERIFAHYVQVDLSFREEDVQGPQQVSDSHTPEED